VASEILLCAAHASVELALAATGTDLTYGKESDAIPAHAVGRRRAHPIGSQMAVIYQPYGQFGCPFPPRGFLVQVELTPGPWCG
jgi:hypothetical protein